jgi:hypothetical protein
MRPVRHFDPLDAPARQANKGPPLTPAAGAVISESKTERLAKLHALGDEAADHFRAVLPEGLSLFRHVVAPTHVPRFRESCWHEGRISDDNSLPFFFARKAVGDALADEEADPTGR